MGTLAIFCTDAELPEAVQQFAHFEELGVTTERIDTLDALDGIADLEGLIIQTTAPAWESLDMVRRLRASEKTPFLPVLLFLPDLNNYFKAVCFDFEFVLPCSLPPSGHELVPGLKKMVWFARKKQEMLHKRTELEKCLRLRKFENFENLLAAFNSHEKDPFRSQLIKARMAFEQRDLPLALELVTAAIKENNRSLEARNLLNAVYCESGPLEKVQSIVEKNLAMAADHPPFIATGARLALMEAKWAESLALFEKSYALDPGQGAVIAGMLACQIILQKPGEAKTWAKKLEPSMVKHLHSYCLDLGRSALLNEAETILNQSLKLLPQQKDVYRLWMNLGIQAKRARKMKKAQSFFQACAAAAPAGYDKAQQQLREIEVILKKAQVAKAS